MTELRIVKRLRKSLSDELPTCTKHGPYKGPYCPFCYEKAMGSPNSKGLGQIPDS